MDHLTPVRCNSCGEYYQAQELLGGLCCDCIEAPEWFMFRFFIRTQTGILANVYGMYVDAKSAFDSYHDATELIKRSTKPIREEKILDRK